MSGTIVRGGDPPHAARDAALLVARGSAGGDVMPANRRRSACGPQASRSGARVRHVGVAVGITTISKSLLIKIDLKITKFITI